MSTTRFATPCIECGELTRNGTRCPTHARTAHRMGTGWKTISQRIIKRDQGICHWCGATATTADHLTPRSKGGTNAMDNLVASCRPCNSRRGNRG